MSFMRLPVVIAGAFIFSVSCLAAAELPDFHSATKGKAGYPDNEATSKEPLSSFFAKFLEPPPGYGQVPFYWFTGDQLTKERLSWQLDFLAGRTLPGVNPEEMPQDYPMPRISGVQINNAHARGSLDGKPFGFCGTTYPLDPPLFTPEFWELWAWLLEEADHRNIGVGISDYTLAWPGQGFIVDEVVADPARQGKALKMQKSRVAQGNIPAALPTQITTLERPLPDDEIELYTFYWEPQPKSLDLMDEQTGFQITDKFFGESERQVPEQFRQALNFFFQDELIVGIRGLIWTPDFAEEFQKRKGYDLRPQLLHLFEKVDDTTPKIRLDYHDVVMDLSESRYFKTVCDWHTSRGKLYGCDQMSRGLNPMEYGDYFRAVRWFSAPGHDTPGSGADIVKGKVSSSISHLYGAPRVWLEGYHSAGWGMTLENLTRTTNENYAVGCNLLSLHGLYYTTHGGFWEWAPPCYHFRMPYWQHTGVWLRYFERLSFLLSQGTHVADVAIVYPVEQGAAGFDVNRSTNVAFELGRGLYPRGIDFDFIDGQSIARSTIKDKKMNVAGESYRVLILPAMKALRWNAVEKIRDFYRGGGIVIALECTLEASDRVGANDPELRKIMEEIFGSGETTNVAGGQGFLLPAGGTQKASDDDHFGLLRVYGDGFEGHWVWSDTVAQDVVFKTVWNQGKQRVKYRFFVDNVGSLYVNGKPIVTGVDHGRGGEGEIDLDDGDVIVAQCHDLDNPGGATAGFFFAAVVDGKTVLSSTEFRCSTRTEDWDSETWRRSDKMDELDEVTQKFVHPLHSLAARKALQHNARAVDEIVTKNIVRDFEVDGGAWVLHRRSITNDGDVDIYFVQHAEKDAWATFRATGEVQLWDAWNGVAFRLTDVEKLSDGRTRVRLPLEKAEGRIIAFVPSGVNQEELPVYHRYVEAAPAETIEGDWEGELVPTMDNTFGDFRMPVEKDPFDGSYLLGAEARRFKTYRTEIDGANTRFTTSNFDDADWATATCGYGEKMYVYNVKEGENFKAVESTLLSGKAPEMIDSVQRQPYRFSWRWGVEGKPGEQGFHGLKKIVLDEFLIVPKGVTYFTAWISLSAPSTVFMEFPEYLAPEDIVPEGRIAPSDVWIDGKQVGAETTLEAGLHHVVIKYEQPGRSYVVFSTKKEDDPATRTPLAMKWFDRQSLLRYSPHPEQGAEQWFRFVSPPGLVGLAFTSVGECTVFVDGVEYKPSTVTDSDKIVRVDIPSTLRKREAVTVAIRVRNAPWGINDGEAFPNPIKLRCEKGTISLGDWASQGVMETYSGGVWYRKSVRIDEKELADLKAMQGRIRLDLGQVTASCEVRMNGRLAAVLATSPWNCDVTPLLVAGENEISVLVMNTLANHYRTIPSEYQGNPRSGLFGPVRLLREKRITE